MYVAKEKKKPPVVVVAQKSGAKVVSGTKKANVDRSEIRAILHADTDRDKRDGSVADQIEVKRRADQDKTPDDSEA